jgi:hypothetical protein
LRKLWVAGVAASLTGTAQAEPLPTVVGAANLAKQNATESAERIAAVKYLGTLDCRYLPDAEAALIAALRADGQEAVRFEAATVLARGCCCTPKVMESLVVAISGSERDGRPAEKSPRVRLAAARALEKCLAVNAPAEDTVPPAAGKPGPKVVEHPRVETGPIVTEMAAPKWPDLKLIEASNQTLVEFRANPENARPEPAPAPKSAPIATHAPVVKQAPVTVEPPAPVAVAVEVAPMPTVVVPPPVKMPVVEVPPMKVEPATSPVPEIKLPDVSIPETKLPPLVAPEKPTIITVAAPAVVVSSAPTTPVEAPPTVVPASRAEAATAPTESVSFRDLVKKLYISPNVADRHAAIRDLVKLDREEHPGVVRALIARAKYDPSDAVRVDCIRHIVHHKMATPEVVAELSQLTRDKNEWVRGEAEKAVAEMKKK